VVEDLDDVQSVHADFEIDEALMEQMPDAGVPLREAAEVGEDEERGAALA
jgi:hypothetical protein